jgi:hypothetical protein
MKGHTKSHHKGRHHKADGGPMTGDDDAMKDEAMKPKRYNQSNVEDEAEERKHGGRTKRRHGGRMKHHDMHVHGEHAKHHAGRKPRKSGGRATSDANPITSAGGEGTSSRRKYMMKVPTKEGGT